MTSIDPQDPVAVAVVDAVHRGDLGALTRLLAGHPGLAAARLGDDGPGGMTRSLLHVATDWPGHYPDVAATIGTLIAAGADVHARFTGPHAETPLHWAASSDDVAALDALLDHGADIEAGGAVIGGGTPLADAVAFAQWAAATRLVERGAHANLWQAAGLGLMPVLADRSIGASPQDVTGAFWCACHGGRQEAAAYLLDRGADLHWVGWDQLTALQAARRSGADDLAAWLVTRGAAWRPGLTTSPDASPR